MPVLDSMSGALLWICDHKDLQNAHLQGDRVLKWIWTVFPYNVLLAAVALHSKSIMKGMALAVFAVVSVHYSCISLSPWFCFMLRDSWVT